MQNLNLNMEINLSDLPQPSPSFEAEFPGYFRGISFQVLTGAC